MKTVKWITPRILCLERVDSFGETFFDISYGVWDIDNPREYRRALELLQAGVYEAYPCMAWFETPTKEINTEERRFIRIITGEEEQLETPAYKQIVRNFGYIYAWCPYIKEPVLRDLKLLSEEDPALREEWHSWYNWRRYGDYRKPRFYEKDLATKVPIREKRRSNGNRKANNRRRSGNSV